MLQALPIEVLQQVISYLPTASSIINVSLVNRKLFELISAEDYAVFRRFVQTAFPSIHTPPLWMEAARTLTSRSRAWDLRSFVARECYPPPDDTFSDRRTESPQKFGYVPVIDSYETWTAHSWADRKEVLAWGAAGRLRLRIKERNSTTWKSLRGSSDHLPQQDILDVQLLRPHQNQGHGETILIRRANNEIILLEADPESDHFERKTVFECTSPYVDCLDVSTDPEPLLAICNTKSVQLYPVNAKAQKTEAVETLYTKQNLTLKHRNRCIKFISDNVIATGIQFVEGRDRGPINVYNIRPSGLSETPISPLASISSSKHSSFGRQCANIIAPVTDLSARQGKMFLSGWTDGIARLHDMRMPLTPVAEYVDAVDDGQILSLLPIGQERFLAGSHQNACLKTFDFRMPGARCYFHTDARAGMQNSTKRWNMDDSNNSSPSTRKFHLTRRDINIFLAMSVKTPSMLWMPLPRRSNNRLPRYRGSIYSLSSPSPSSPTIYAGIENHVIQLDFVSSDDVNGGMKSLNDPLLSLENEHPDNILNLSCYERPRTGRESTDVVLLRNQLDWNIVKKMHEGSTANKATHDRNHVEEGWDPRWRLASHDLPKDRVRNRWSRPR